MNKETKVGLFVVVTLILLYFGFSFLRGINVLSPANKYYVVYNNVDQLSISNPVLINGYVVGRVSHISILQERKNKVLVELNIDSDIVLGDSTVATLSADFLGNKSILLNTGNLDFPIQRGDTLYAEVARGLLDMFTEQAEPVANNIQVTLRKMDVVMDLLVISLGRVDTLFSGMAETPKLINQLLMLTSRRIDSLSSSMVNTSDIMAVTLREMRPVARNLNAFSYSLSQLKLAETLAETKATLEKLSRTLARTARQDNTVGRMLTEDSLYVNMNRLLLRLDTLARHINTHPKHFLGPLAKTQKQIERDLQKKERKHR